LTALMDASSIRARAGGPSMSVADPSVSPPAETSPPSQSHSRLREKLRGWLALAILLGVVGTPLYGVYVLSEMYTFQPNFEKAGGSVQLEVVGPQWFKDFAGRDHDWLFGTPIRLSAPRREKVDDRWARRLRRMTNLQTLGLANTQLSDRGMASLAALTELRDLDLSNTAIGDVGLEQICYLTNLEVLSLHGTQVSDEGLRCLARLENLSVLDLSHTRVRGSGLRHLANMLQLQSLSLDATELDDAGLAQLPVLPSLQVLELGSTKITSAGPRGLMGRRSISCLSIANTQVDDACVKILPSVGFPARLDGYSSVRLTVAIEGTKITHRGISLLRGLQISPDHPGRSVSEEIRAQRDWASNWAK
jgi:hypothetical protein